MTTLILHTETDRVIFFSIDPTFVPSPQENSLVHEYDRPLPSDMSLMNCWNWKLVNSGLVNTSPVFVDKEQQVFDSNKKELLAQLHKKVDQLLTNLRPSRLSDYTERLKTEAAAEVIAGKQSGLIEKLSEITGQTLLETAKWITTSAQFLEERTLALELKAASLLHALDRATTVQEHERVRRDIVELKHD